MDILNNESLLITLLISTCAFSVVGLISWALITSALRSRKEAQASQNWPSVAGTVVSAKVVQGAQSRSSVTTYSASITYEYEVRGEHYRSSNISFSGDMQPGDRAHAQSLVDKYLANPNVIVYYDPANPTQAALDRKIGNSSKVLIWAGATMLLFTCCLISVLIGVEFLP